jgi:hypothetical protein
MVIVWSFYDVDDACKSSIGQPLSDNPINTVYNFLFIICFSLNFKKSSSQRCCHLKHFNLPCCVVA